MFNKNALLHNAYYVFCRLQMLEFNVIISGGVAFCRKQLSRFTLVLMSSSQFKKFFMTLIIQKFHLERLVGCLFLYIVIDWVK